MHEVKRMAGLSKPMRNEPCFTKERHKKTGNDLHYRFQYLFSKNYFASKILNTPLMEIIAPMNNIIHDTKESTQESKAKRA